MRDDFWASTSNKQLNFVQHVKTLLEINGRAAVVVPDNVLFEGGAGETVRRKLLHECDVHTLLRLPDGHLLRPGGEGERPVLRPEARRARSPWTKKLWIYDLRTNKHFTLKTNPLKRADLDEFVDVLPPGEPPRARSRPGARRTPRAAGASYAYDELVARDKVQPRHLLAEGREPGGLREPARPRRHRGGDRRGPARRPGAVRGNSGATWLRGNPARIFRGEQNQD